MLEIKLKVIPNASRDLVSGWLEDVLKIKVTAAPEKGKANLAVKTLLATTLKISRSRLKIISGTNTQQKTIQILDLSIDEFRAKLESAK